MISWEEELLARLASEPIQEIVIVVRIEIVLDGVAEAEVISVSCGISRYLCSP